MTAVHLAPGWSAVRQLPQLAHRLEAAGFDGLWVGEVNDLDAVVPAALAAHGSERAAIGTLLNVYTRGPATLAMTAASLGAVAPGRMNVVLGVASPLLVERWNGQAYRRPFARLRDVLRFLRATLEGERVRDPFESFTVSGFALHGPPRIPPKLLVAACGPMALELAAVEADGVVLNWLAPADLERIGPLPNDRSRVWLVVPVCPMPDRSDVERVMRPLMADYLNAPAYAELQRRMGRGDALAPMWEAWARGDRTGCQAAVPRVAIDELVVWGTPAECRSRLAAIEATTGVHAIATFFLPPGAPAPW